MKNPPKAKPLRTNPFGGMSDPPSSNIDPNYPRPQDYPHMSDHIASPDPMDVDRRPLREDVGGRNMGNMGNVGVTGGRGIGGHKIASFPFQYLGASREGGEVGNPQELINTYKPFVGVGLNVTKHFDILKTYFDINNEYVLKKLKIILLPVLHKDWKRVENSHSQGGDVSHLTGRYDVNAPDLYIPIMGLITFMLIVAFSSGLYSTFSTELLGLTFTTCITFWIIEGLFMFASLYIFNVQNYNLLELYAYSGYKYVSLSLTYVLFSIEYGLFYPALLLNGVMSCIFMFKTLKRFTHHYTLAENIGFLKAQKTTFIAVCSVCQILIEFLIISIISYLSIQYLEYILCIL